MFNTKLVKVVRYIQWIAAAFCAVMSIGCFSHGGVGVIGGIILFISALLISPISNKFNIMCDKPLKKAALQVIGSFALFIIGVSITPSSSIENDTTLDNDSDISNTSVEQVESSDVLTTTTTSKLIDIVETTTTTTTEPTTTTTESTTTTTTEPTTTTETMTTTKKPTTTKPKTTTTTTTITTTTTTTTTEPTATVTTIQTQPIVRKYWINHDSKIVHSTSCYTIPDNKEDYWEYFENLDINWAEANGYRACQKCDPVWHN